VDLNSADEDTLLGLPGIGPSRARAIVAYRTAHGAFRSLSQLLQIKGIGRSLLRQLRPLVTLSGSTG
jgi:competence protein ComEA